MVGTSALRRCSFPVLLISLICFPPDGRSELGFCAGSGVRVEYSDINDFHAVCSGAGAAMEFMARQGFDTTFPLTIRIGGTDLTQHEGERVFGKYSVPSSSISVLSYEDCEALPDDFRLFGQIVTPALHRSFVAHEVAHAVAQYNSTAESLPVVAQEYIAYVVQFATMPEELRKQILEYIPNEGFENFDEMSSLFWALNPEIFGVKVFRHHQSTGAGNFYLKELTKGNVMGD